MRRQEQPAPLRLHRRSLAAGHRRGDEADRATDRLEQYGIHNYFDPSRAVPSLEALANYRDVTEREYERPAEFEIDREKAQRILEKAVERGVDNLSVEAMEILDAYGIPTPAGKLVESASEAEAIAEEIDGPVVMKIVSPDILHKSDIGGVEVGVATEDVHLPITSGEGDQPRPRC